MLHRRVSQLIASGDLVAAVALLRTAEDVGAAVPETSAPENFLLCSELSLEAMSKENDGDGSSGSDAKYKESMLQQARECYRAITPSLAA